MRRKKLLVVAFLLMFYIGPMILASSYSHAAILAEPNMEKDFALSTEYDTSEQSITSFSETLPDDVLFYPDSFYDGTIELADYGEDQDENYDPNYVKTQALDNDAFEEIGIDIEVWFYIDEGLEGFSYASYLYASSQDDCNIGIWNFDTTSFDNFEEPLPTSYDWMNGTVYDHNYWNATHIGFQLSEVGIGDANFYWDYAEITLFKMTLADADHYAESFADVSDWGIAVGEASPTTDDDVGTFVTVGDDNYDYYYDNAPSYDALGQYIEIRLKGNNTGIIVYFMGKDADDFGGATIWQQSFYPTTDWVTLRYIIASSGVVESFGIAVKHATLDSEADFDYIRVSPANETGWQYDGSTTTGVAFEYLASVTSDGDKLNVTGLGTGDGYFELIMDTTTTLARIEEDYYEFIEIMISSVNNADEDSKVGLPRIYGSDGNAYIPAAVWFVESGLIRMNIEASTSGDPYKLRIYVDEGDYFLVDYVKLYSIANFTVTQSGTSTDDILYVDSGFLYCEGTSFTSITLDHDPALSIDTTIGDLWTLTTSSGTPQIDFYIDAAWVGYTSETAGSFEFGTLTDIRIKFIAPANIEAITFLIHIPEWNLVGTAILHFNVLFHMWGYNTALIILGLVMIPTSTIYLAYGAKHDRSSNRLFYGLIIFFLGCGLFIGGIMP